MSDDAAVTLTKDETIRLQAAEIEQLREEKVALISAKTVTINPPPMPESEVIDYLRQTIDRQNQDIARLRDEGQKDYDGMREFQRKFIDASHEIERLRSLVYEAIDCLEHVGCIKRIREALGE